MAGYVEFRYDMPHREINSASTSTQNQTQNKCSHEYFAKYQLNEHEEKRCETFNISSSNKWAAATKADARTSTTISFELARLMLKQSEQTLELKAAESQSFAVDDLVQQPRLQPAGFSHRSEHAYDIFAAERLQLSSFAIDTKRKYNKRRRTSFKRGVAIADDGVGMNSYVCDCKTPSSRQRLRHNITKNKCTPHRGSNQTATTHCQYWPNTVGVAPAFETASASVSVAAPAATMKVSAAEISTAAGASRSIAADAVLSTVTSKLASSLLPKIELLDANVNANRSEHAVTTSTIKVGRPITITTTIKTGVISLMRNAFLMVAIFLLVLTLQRVSGQYLLAIAPATTPATATTSSTAATPSVATKSRSMLAIVAARHIGATTTNPMSSTNSKYIFDISEIANFNERPASKQSEALRKEFKTKQREQKLLETHGNGQKLWQQTQWLLNVFDAQSSNLLRNSVGVLSSADTETRSSKYESEAGRVHQTDVASGREINQRSTASAHEPNNTGPQQQPAAVQQQRRSKRSATDSIGVQLEGNRTSDSAQQRYKSTEAEGSIDTAGAGGSNNATNIFTNNYDIRQHNALRDVRGNEHSINDQKLLKLVMDGLGLQQLPNMKKVNISQHEYVTKYREYLRLVHERKRRELAELAFVTENNSEWELEQVPLHIVSIAPNVTEYETYSRRKRNIQNFLHDFPPTKDGETVTENFLLPRKQRNNDGKPRQKQKGRTSMILHFALEKKAAQLQPGEVEEANIRLMLIHSSALAVKSNKKKQKSKNRPCKSGEKAIKAHGNATAVNNKHKHILNLKVYQRLTHGKRVWLDSSKVNIELDQSQADETHSQWLQFDVTKAVVAWLREQRSNLGLEVLCDNCQRVGARILNDMSSSTSADDTDADDAQLMPILNIIGRLGESYKEIRSNKHSNSAEATHHHHNVATFSNGRQRPNGAIDKHSCHKANQRCCRHTMEVVFKEIKGFEFIIQPKVFDAGYCHGRCPPRYNPAHHHAMLQSLIWKQNRERAPRPCCAPSKLVELEVLHVDEKDSEKLKISTWTDMRVVECACS